MDRIKKFFKFIYLKLVRINDTPHRIALGFGTGVFLGILPTVGPLVTLALAAVLRVNKASALLGCLLTNTWLSVVSFLFAVKLGSLICGVEWQEIYDISRQLMRNFHWADFMKASVLKMFLPVFVGYFLIAAMAATAAYVVSFGIYYYFKRKRSKETG